jgi:cbb3-type cytochrome oxidase maturation protein
MDVLIFLVPLALLLGLTGLFTFVWALRSGQFDDMDGAALRVLSDDDVRGEEQARPSKNTARD